MINLYCNRCNSKVTKELELDYPYYCPECDENLYSFEVHEGNMRSITEMLNYLKSNITTHGITLEGNTIIAKRKIKTRSFSSFKITYLKGDKGLSFKNTSFDSYALRFTKDDDLFCQLGAVSDIKNLV